MVSKSVALFLVLLIVPLSSWSDVSHPAVESFKNDISRHLNESKQYAQVFEFQYIRQQAEKLGVRVWLYGGTAASFASFIREEGSGLRALEKLELDEIITESQDIDLVMDGPKENVQELAKRIRKRFPYQRNTNSKWDVIHYNEPLGPRDSIGGNPDLKNQHTDSWSTGLIELTDPPINESRFIDTRLSLSEGPRFIEDIYNRSINYYFSDTHETTLTAKEGRNPPIISAIRYLTKAYHFGLGINKQDLVIIQNIAETFDPNEFTGDSKNNRYVVNWMKHNIRKLLINARDRKSAILQLEALKLKDKLLILNISLPNPDSDLLLYDCVDYLSSK